MQSLAACITWWEGMEMLEIFAYRTVAVVHFTDQNWIPKTVYCIRCVLVCNWNAKIALFHVCMVVTYYIKLFRTWADRRHGILISLLLLVAETTMTPESRCFRKTILNRLLRILKRIFNLKIIATLQNY